MEWTLPMAPSWYPEQGCDQGWQICDWLGAGGLGAGLLLMQ